MTLREYFQDTKGIGVLATAGADGKVNTAIYSRPHFLSDDDAELAFIMKDRLSHDNVNVNPHVSYLFIEEGGGYVGKRLFLTKTTEETNPNRIDSIRRRNLPSYCDEGDKTNEFLVHFRVEGIRPLIGTGK